jgi:hypothetical protein
MQLANEERVLIFQQTHIKGEIIYRPLVFFEIVMSGV